MVKLRIPATIANLGPGFDCLALAIKLYNEVYIEKIKKGLEIEISGEGKDSLPENKRNLFYQSMQRIFQKRKMKPPPLRIQFQNKIPLARGLGSSATAILGGIVAGNILTGNTLSKEEIINLAVKIEGHADNITASLLGGLTISYQKNKIWSFSRLTPKKSFDIILIIPEEELSTKLARSVLPKQINLEDAVFNISHASLLVGSLIEGNLSIFNEAVKDRIHQPYRAKLMPKFNKIMKELEKANVLCSGLCGAGPSTFAFIKKDDKKTLLSIKKLLIENSFQGKVVITEIDKKGLTLTQR